MTARLLGRDDRVPQPQNGSRMTFPRFDTSRIATGLTVGGIASSSMRSRLRLAFAPAVFGALRDLTNNYAAALALAGALQCAAAALVLAAKPRRSRRRLRAPRKADDVDPFFPLAVAANALAGFPGPARAYPIAAERMPRRRRRAPLHPHDEPRVPRRRRRAPLHPHDKPRDDPGCAATRPAPRERHAALQSARPVSSIPPRLGENHPVSTAPLASRSKLLPRGCDAWPPRVFRPLWNRTSRRA